MPSDAQLNVVLQLLDNASGGIKAAMASIKADTQGVTDANKKLADQSSATSKQQENDLQKASIQYRQFRRELGFLLIEYTLITLAVKTWGDYNIAARDSMEEFGSRMKEVFGLVGSLFTPAFSAFSEGLNAVLPGMKMFIGAIEEIYADLHALISFVVQFAISFVTEITHGVNIINALKDSFKTASTAATDMYKKMKDMFVENIPQIDEAANKLKHISDALKIIDTEAQVGAISLQKYFAALISGDNAAIAQNNIMIQSIKQLATLQIQTSNQDLMAFKNSTEQKISLLKFYQQEFNKAHQSMASFAVSLGESIQKNVSSALTDIITGAKSAGQAFAELGQAMISMIVNFVAEWVVSNAIMWALQAAGLIKTVATTAAAAATLASAWFPAAVFASVATLGAAGASGAAGLALAGQAALGVAALGKFAGFGGGGNPSGGASGSFASGTPEVPKDMIAQIHQGETIIPASFADAIRSGQLSLSGGNQSTVNQGGVTVNVYYPKMNSKSDIQKLANDLGLEIQRQLRYAI